jgi:8-oxo-dGTP diphosphatase
VGKTIERKAAGVDVTLVRAAGGLVTRFDETGRLEVLVVHRARYDDWSFPKGKLDEGETFEDAALREVAEETGLVCTLDGELAPIRYRDASGRPKIVRYWRMTPLEGDIGSFVFNAEIDDLRWLGATEALDLLTYQHDRDLLAAL